MSNFKASRSFILSAKITAGGSSATLPDKSELSNKKIIAIELLSGSDGVVNTPGNSAVADATMIPYCYLKLGSGNQTTALHLPLPILQRKNNNGQPFQIDSLVINWAQSELIITDPTQNDPAKEFAFVVYYID